MSTWVYISFPNVEAYAASTDPTEIVEALVRHFRLAARREPRGVSNKAGRTKVAIADTDRTEALYACRLYLEPLRITFVVEEVSWQSAAGASLAITSLDESSGPAATAGAPE